MDALKNKLMTYISPEPYLEGHASYTHVKEMVDELSKLGWKITCIYPDHKEYISVFDRLLNLFKLNIKAIMDKNKIVYIRWHFGLFPFVFINFFLKKNIVIEVNGKIEDLFIAWKFTKYFHTFFYYLMAFQLKKACLIVTVTPGLLSYCQKTIGINEQKIKCIANGVNTELFNPKAKNLIVNLDIELPPKFGILFGSLTKWQGIREVIASINSEYWVKDCAVIFIGQGKEVAFIKQSALKNQLILYNKPVAYQMIARIIARSSFSLVCGKNLLNRATNGLAPLKLFESMACGVPVIATNMPFQSNIIKASNAGIILPNTSPSTIARAVKTLLDDSFLSTNYGYNGNLAASRLHSWESRAKDLDDILLMNFVHRPA